MTVRLLRGDCRAVLKTLPDRSVHMAVTSPPYYGLRSYLPADHPDKTLEIGSEATPEAYVEALPAPVPCTVLDPFGGAGTTGMVADRLQRHAILIELNPKDHEITKRRLRKDGGMFAEVRT
jgi:DNA modification methylase